MAKGFSIVAHPLLLPSYLYAVLLLGYPEMTGLKLTARLYILLSVVVFTFALPMLQIIGMYYLKFISSLQMPERKERPLPLFLTAVMYLFFVYFFKEKIDLGSYFLMLAAGITASLGVAFTWTLRLKVSLHSLALGGVLAALFQTQRLFTIFDFFWPFWGFALLSGAVMSSRLYLNAHRPLEIYLGFILGVLACGGCLELVRWGLL